MAGTILKTKHNVMSLYIGFDTFDIFVDSIYPFKNQRDLTVSIILSFGYNSSFLKLINTDYSILNIMCSFQKRKLTKILVHGLFKTPF